MSVRIITDSARLYADKIDVNDPGNFRIAKVGATIGTYAGPGAIAVAFFAR
jgi:fatty acid-binding protein DegV